MWPFKKKPKVRKTCQCGHLECFHFSYTKICMRCSCVNFITEKVETL